MYRKKILRKTVQKNRGFESLNCGTTVNLDKFFSRLAALRVIEIRVYVDRNLYLFFCAHSTYFSLPISVLLKKSARSPSW